MRIKKEEIKNLLDAIEDLIDIKVIIRKISPTYELTDSLQEEFENKLLALKKKLTIIFSTYLKQKSQIKIEKNIEILKQKISVLFNKGNIALVSSNSAKKILKNIGVDPRKLIISGGPFFIEDYEKINPGIQKKCNRLIKELKDEDWQDKDLYFIYENRNKSDKLTLDKINLISQLIEKDVKTIEINSWNDFKE